jgi:hypothetical protein
VALRLSCVSIAATYDVPNLAPWGSHPLLDPNYSSGDVRIRHDGVTLSRLAKTKIVADWDTALQNLRVCNRTAKYRQDSLNCGECEKCTRTMLALLAIGALKRTRAFPRDDVSEDMASNVWINDAYEASCYRDVIAPLREKGRLDLVRGISRAIARYHGEKDWKDRLARFDRTYLGGNIVRFKRRFSSKPHAVRSSIALFPQEPPR